MSNGRKGSGMADEMKLEARVKSLERALAVRDDVEAIKRLKYRYFRCLDSKLWDELAECFTEDATTSYSGGKYGFQGRDAIIKFLREGLCQTRISMHHGHHPEIDITGDSTATGVWALEDCVIDTEFNLGIRGAAFYRDEYVKENGEWKIRSTGYTRVFEEMWDRGESKSLKISANMHQSSG
jgi:bile-acid 7alpha-dehydratase